MGIQHRTSSVAYSQANGQVEVINRLLLSGMKKRLDDAKGRWTEELYNVLWAYRTTPRTATGETPFKLAYGTEALIPLDVGVGADRIATYDLFPNIEGLKTNMDLLDEVREEAVNKISKYQAQVSKYFSKRVHEKTFEIGDLVLRKTAALAPSQTGKLMLNWEGPYKIIGKPRIGTYKLSKTDGTVVKNTWHASSLRKYYQ